MQIKNNTVLMGKAKDFCAFGFIPPSYDGMQNQTRMKFLYDSISRFATRASGVALEVGVYKGCSLLVLSKACLRKGINRIYGMDLFTGTESWGQTFDTYDETQSRLERYRLQNQVKLIRSHSLEYAWDKPIDVLHIDADHDYEAVKADALKYLPFVNDKGIIVFDDYDASHPGVMKAVHELLLIDGIEIVNVNCPGVAYGSVCLRKRHVTN